jgi:hypothetical protein
VTALVAELGDGTPYGWVESSVRLVLFALGWAMAFWLGRVYQSRRFATWAAANPTEVYELAEHLREAELRQAERD